MGFDLLADLIGHLIGNEKYPYFFELTTVVVKFFFFRPKRVNNHCHFKLYGDYIKKKLFFLYTKKKVYPGNTVVYKQCQEAYNEKHWVNFHDMFGFYDGAECELPYCLTKQAYKIETLIKNIVKATNINNETRRGVVQCICIKRCC